MNTQIVRFWMTSDPVTIGVETTLAEAKQLMEKHYIHRLPVIKKGKLIGIVTGGDIHIAQASNTTVSVDELNQLLDGLPAKAFMAYDPIVVEADATIEKAAHLMLQHKIGGLPVVDNGELVGIITETDFCRILLAQSDYAERV